MHASTLAGFIRHYVAVWCRKSWGYEISFVTRVCGGGLLGEMPGYISHGIYYAAITLCYAPTLLLLQSPSPHQAFLLCFPTEYGVTAFCYRST
jgi:hypothetical protein